MRRLGKLLARALLGLVGVMLVVALTLLLAGDWIYPRLLETVARSNAGLALTTRGPVTVQWWPVPGVTAADLGVTPVVEPVWDVQLQQIQISVEGHSLLRGKLVLENVEISGARVRASPSGSAEPFESGTLAVLTRANIRVDDARIEIQGAAARGPHTIQIDRYASGPGPDGHPRVEARGSVDGSALSVDGQFSAVAERSGDVMAFPLTASVSIPGWALTGTLQGHVAQPLEGRGLALTTSLEIGDVTALVDLLGLPGPLAGSMTLHATVDGDLPSPRLASIKATLADEGGLSARLEGAGISPSSGTIDSLQVSLDGPWPAGGPRQGGAAPGVSGEVRIKGAPGRYQVELDRAQLTIGDRTQLEASGTLELQAFNDWRAAQGQLEVKASTANVAALSDLAGVTLPDLGPASLRGQLSGPLTSATLTDAQLEVGTQGKGVLHLTAKGKAGPLQLGPGAKLMAATATDLQLQVSTVNLAALSDLVGVTLPDLGPASLRGQLSGPLTSATLEDAELEAGTKGKGVLHVTARGKAGPLQLGSDDKRMAATTTDLQLQASTANLAALSDLFGVELPDLGPASLRGRLSGPLTGAMFEDTELVLGTKGRGVLHLMAKGKAGPLQLGPGEKRMAATAADLQLQASTANLAALSHLVGVKLPDLGPASLRGRLSGPLTGATLTDAELELGRKGRGALHLTAKGKTGPLQLGPGAHVMATAETDVRLDLRVDDVKALAADLPPPLKTLEPWTVRTHLRTTPERWRMGELAVSAGSKNTAAVNLSGKLAGRGDVVAGVKRMLAGAAKKGDTADLGVTLETANARATAGLIGINIPELGALKGSARIGVQDARGLSVRGLSVRSLGALSLHLAGDIGVLHGLRDVVMDLTLAETRPEVIDRLLDLELPLARNVSLKSTLRRPGQEVLGIEGEARVGSSRFALALTAERTATVPLVKGRIHSAHIQGKDFWDEAGVTPRGTSRGAPPQGGLGLLDIVPGLDFVLQDSIEQQEEAEKGGKADELPWHRLKQVEIELDVHVDTVQGVYESGGPLDLRLVDRAGRLEFGPFKLAYEGGALTIQGFADSNSSPPSVEVKGRGEKLPVQELAAYGRLKSAGLAGELNVDYHLRARGLSLPQLRAGLGGEIRTMLEHGRAPVRSLDLLSADLLDWVGTLVESDASTPVPCALIDLQIKGGVADAKTFYVKTDKSAVYGIGKLDLRDDTVDLTIMPKVSGITLSPPTSVRVHGPLASPSLQVVNPGAVALHYGIEVAEDVAFPPLIVLRKLFSGGASKTPGPCH